MKSDTPEIVLLINMLKCYHSILVSEREDILASLWPSTSHSAIPSQTGI